MGCSLGTDPENPCQSVLDVRFSLASWTGQCGPERVCGWAPGDGDRWLCWETPGNEATARAGEERVPMVIIRIGDNEMECDPGGVAASTPNPLVPR